MAPGAATRWAGRAAARTPSPRRPCSRTGSIAATAVASVAPYAADGLDFLAGMGAENVVEFDAALAGSAALEPLLEGQWPALRDVAPDDIADALGDLIPPVDRTALTGELAQEMAEDIQIALRDGIWGWFDDDIAFTRPWGFDLASIRVPLSIWQGEQDRMVPYAHGEWLAAALPHARCPPAARPRPPLAGRRLDRDHPRRDDRERDARLTALPRREGAPARWPDAEPARPATLPDIRP